MKRFVRTLAFVALIGTAHAQQEVIPGAATDFNWNQTTGLINIPVARTLPAGTFYSAFDFKSASVRDLFGSEFKAGGAAQGDRGNGSFHFMFAPHRRLEIATMGLHDVDRGGNVNTLGRLLRVPPASSFSTSVKFLVADETEDFPAIAVGVENLTYPKGPADPEPDQRFREPGYYAVASKSFPSGDNSFTVHGGFGTGRFHNRPFGGLEYTFDNGLGLITEYDGYQVSGGVRYTGIKNLRITAGVQGGDPTFQIGYHFNPFDLFQGKGQRDYNPYKSPVKNKRDHLDEGPTELPIETSSPPSESKSDSAAPLERDEVTPDNSSTDTGQPVETLPIQSTGTSAKADWRTSNPYLQNGNTPETAKPKAVQASNNWKAENPYLRNEMPKESKPATPSSQSGWRAQNPYLQGD